MKNVVLLYGGRSYEHDVSVITAIEVGQWCPQQYRLYPVYMRDGEWWLVKDWQRFGSYTSTIKGRKVRLDDEGLHVGLKTVKVDCVLLATHGGEGEDGRLQSLLEWWGLPYTSCDPLTSGILMDKLFAKSVLKERGFVVAPAYPQSAPVYPVIVKPARLGSSIGVGVARNEEEYRQALANAEEYDRSVLVEQFLEGAVEYNCAVLRDGDQLLVSEIECPRHTGDTYTFGQKYQKECEHALPAPMEDGLREEIKRTTSSLYTALRCKGVVRVDYLYHQGTLYVNEVNTIPGALSYRLFGAAGVSIGKLLTILIENASCQPRPKVKYGELLDDLIGAWK